MKTKKYFAFALLLIFFLPIIHSCVTTDKVTNSKIIQKRKYNKGFYVDLFSSKKTRSIKQNNEQQLVINTIDIPDNNKQQQTESFYLNYENDNTIETKDILLTSAENIVIYPSIKKYTHIDNKNKIVQTKPKNNAIGEDFIFAKKKLNTKSKPILYDEKLEINKIALAGFILAILGLLTLFLSFYFSFILGIYISFIFSIPAIPLSIIGYSKGRMNGGKVFGIIGFILGILGYFVATVYYFWSFYVSLEGCSIM
jgi:hypothetical protein